MKTPAVPQAPNVSSAAEQAQRLQDYKWAKQNESDPKACETFTRLGAMADFPAHDIARLRAVEACPQDTMSERTDWPVWLRDLATDVLLSVAGTHGDKVQEMDLAAEKSKQKLTQAEKIKWMNLAIQRAQELQLPDATAAFQKRLYGIAPRLNPLPREAQDLAIARDYRMARQFDQARSFYERVLKGGSFDLDDKIQALKGIRLTYKNQRQTEKHLASARRLIRFLQSASKRTKSKRRLRNLLTALYDAQVYYARALWTEGRAKEASALFAILARTMKGRVPLAEVYWLQARMAEEAKDYDKVSSYLDRAMKERFSDMDLRDKVLWYNAWNERRRQHYDQAIAVFQQIDKDTQIDFTRQRALFWLGKTYDDNKQGDLAKTTYTRLMDLDPLGYYGLLAHKQMNVPITLQGAPAGESPKAAEALDISTADCLFQIEESDALTAFLDAASQAYRKRSDQNDDGWTQIFKYYARAGLYMKLYDSLGSLTPERRKTLLEHHPELLFPQPWSDEVQAAADQFGVKPELIYAIARQESAFDPHARSLADAFGLMQLLPEVARDLSHKYKIPYSNMEDLYDPKTNIELGAAQLKELFDRYKGQFILSVAAYNASDAAIHGWMKTRFHGDSLEFIEEIPYEETRAYVRLVMRNMIFYRLLNSKAESLIFPTEVLNL